MASALLKLPFQRRAGPARGLAAARRADASWLSTLLRPDSTPGDIRAALVTDLFTRTSSLAVGGLICMAVGACAWWRTDSAWCLAWLALDGLLYACRLGITFLFRRRAAAGTLGNADHWALLYTLGGALTQLMAGLGCGLCLLTNDPVLRLLSIAVVTGLAGALASRNAGLPRLAFVQLAASLLPLSVGAVPLTGDPWFAVLSVSEALYLVMLCLTVQRNHRDMMQLTMAERENARLLRRFRYLAQHDSLTSLANRSQLLEQLKFAVARLTRSSLPDESLAVLYMDLDGFKAVNDTMGHTMGDRLLCAVADRLREVAAEGDVVARLGGDEFAIIHRRTSRADAEAMAARLVRMVAQPYALGAGRSAHVGLSIGVALAPEHAQNPDSLLQRADLALYAAKTGPRKGTYCLFDAELERLVVERRLLEAELREALAEGRGLVLHYQPIVSFATGSVTAREALVRWRHAERGLVPPAGFIPLAEETGLILPLGEWVLRTACAAAANWPDGARVAVNVSAMQLGRGQGLSDLVGRTLAETGLPAHRLELEVTETALLQESGMVLAQLRALRELGVAITLDDFGTGFSSLAYLRSFTFDRIKIDGSFVRDAAVKPPCAAIVRAVADLGRRLGAVTVAEGIETMEQLALAHAEGCTEAQGFLLGRPEAEPSMARSPAMPPATGRGAGSDPAP